VPLEVDESDESEDFRALQPGIDVQESGAFRKISFQMREGGMEDKEIRFSRGRKSFTRGSRLWLKAREEEGIDGLKQRQRKQALQR
jgi:hypothetical protein